MVGSPAEAVRDADYISMHLPLTDETRGMFNAELIAACTKQPVVINTGRGPCVDADAMVAALADGRIFWYATDVYPTDPPAPDYPLLAAEHVTLTPHIGANSEENLELGMKPVR
jgi:D-3-phosphoglycerate dehydrogenase